MDLACVPNNGWLTLSEGWLTAFKKRCRLKEFKKHGEARSASAEDVENECTHMQELIRMSEYQLKDIFIMDETGLFYV